MRASTAHAGQLRGPGHQVLARLGEHGEHGIVRGISNEHAADQLLPVGREQQFLVDAGKGIFHDQRNGFRGRGLVIAEASHVDAHQLELGGHVGPSEAHVATDQASGRDLGHVPARSDQAVHHASVQSGLANRIDVGIGCLQAVIDRDAAAMADFQSASPGKFVTRADTRRNDDHVDFQPGAIAEFHAIDLAIAQEVLGSPLEVDLHAQVFDLAHQQLRAGIVDLARHQPRRELDHMCLQAQVEGGFGRFQAQQTAADHGTGAGVLGVLDDRVQIFDGAIHEHAPLVDPGNRRHERARASGEHDAVIGDFPALLRHHDLARPVDLGRPVANVDLDAVLAIPIQPRHGQLGRVPVVEVAGEADAIVSRARLLAKCHQAVIATAIKFDEFFAEAMAHRAIPNNNCGLARPRHDRIPP